MRKDNSTNSINERYWSNRCGLTHILSLVGGRWKINILAFLLYDGTMRYNELRVRLKGISEKILIAKLRELEKDGLIDRIVYDQVPPKVEYKLTESGRSLEDIFYSDG